MLVPKPMAGFMPPTTSRAKLIAKACESPIIIEFTAGDWLSYVSFSEEISIP